MPKPETQLSTGAWANLNWDHMRFFLAVARTGTLMGAASVLGIDHTTVSRRIGRLEQEAKVKLFKRSNLGYGLTPAGERLCVAAEKIEAAFLEGISSAQSDHGALNGKIRIGAPDGVGGMFLAAQLPAILETNPGLEIELIATARFFDVTMGEADIAISVSMPQMSRLVFRRLTDYTLLIYGSRDYLAAHKPIRRREDLDEHDFIGYVERDLFAPELNYLGSISPNLKVRFRSTNVLAQAQATLAGRGLCILPHFVARTFPELEPVLPEEIRLQCAYFIQTHEDRRETPVIRKIIDFIVERAAAERRAFLPFREPETHSEGAMAAGGQGKNAQSSGAAASTAHGRLIVASGA